MLSAVMRVFTYPVADNRNFATVVNFRFEPMGEEVGVGGAGSSGDGFGSSAALLGLVYACGMLEAKNISSFFFFSTSPSLKILASLPVPPACPLLG